MEVAMPFKLGLGSLRMSLLVDTSHRDSPDSKGREIALTFDGL